MDGRRRIAIDMDEVMADALREHLRRYNGMYGAALTVADLQGWHLEDYVPPTHRAAAQAMIDASFFENLEVLPDCQAVVQELAARFDVFIVSAAMDVPCSSTRNTGGWNGTSPSFRPDRSCSAVTRASSTPTT
jgi:5'(3')-deoxyribonucleotidase